MTTTTKPEFTKGERVKVEVPHGRFFIRIGTTRMSSSVFSAVVIGPVRYEPGMTMVRLDNGQAKRTLTEYLKRDEPAVSSASGS